MLADFMIDVVTVALVVSWLRPWTVEGDSTKVGNIDVLSFTTSAVAQLPRNGADCNWSSATFVGCALDGVSITKIVYTITQVSRSSKLLISKYVHMVT